jgi:DNA-binding transcriptional ArsR family regulator
MPRIGWATLIKVSGSGRIANRPKGCGWLHNKMRIKVPNDPASDCYSKDILNGLIARIGLPAYDVLAVLAAAESKSGEPVQMPLEKIAERIGKSVETTRLALDVLKQHEIVAIEVQGRNNIYRLTHILT